MRKAEAFMVLSVRNALLNLDLSRSDRFKSRSVGNTVVEVQFRGLKKHFVSVSLHGNLIAKFYFNGMLAVYDCGWQSDTTKSRLNALLSCFTKEAGISQRNYQWNLHLPKGCTDWEGFAELSWEWQANWQCQRAEKTMGWASLTPLTVDALNGQRTIGSVLEPAVM